MISTTVQIQINIEVPSKCYLRSGKATLTLSHAANANEEESAILTNIGKPDHQRPRRGNYTVRPRVHTAGVAY